MANIPTTMRSLIALKKCSPAAYEVLDVPTPTITKPEDVLLRMRAVAINTGDTQVASGMLDVLQKQE